MAGKYSKSKCFIKINGRYKTITYKELLSRSKVDETYRSRKFIPLHGKLMEVSPDEYIQFYKTKNHNDYLVRREAANSDFSIDMLTDDEKNGEDILIDPTQDVAGQVERHIMVEKLRQVLPMLTAEEQRLILALYFKEMTEREYAKLMGVYRNAIHKQKLRILKKLKKLLGN